MIRLGEKYRFECLLKFGDDVYNEQITSVVIHNYIDQINLIPPNLFYLYTVECRGVRLYTYIRIADDRSSDGSYHPILDSYKISRYPRIGDIIFHKTTRQRYIITNFINNDDIVFIDTKMETNNRSYSMKDVITRMIYVPEEIIIVG